MGYSAMKWIYARLTKMAGVTWQIEWPSTFNTLPIACYRLGEDASGALTSEGEGSNRVAFWLDMWHETALAREDALLQIKDTLEAENLERETTRQTVEILADGKKAYRCTTLWSGEYDLGLNKMFRPR